MKKNEFTPYHLLNQAHYHLPHHHPHHQFLHLGKDRLLEKERRREELVEKFH